MPQYVGLAEAQPPRRSTRQTPPRATPAALFAAGLVLTLLFLFAASPASADYDPLGAGTATITLDKTFTRLLQQRRIELLAERDARRRARRLILPVAAGRLDPTTGRGEVEQGGVLVFQHGRRRLPFRRLELKVKRTPLRSPFGIPRVRLASAGPSAARTQGGRIASPIGPTEDAAARSVSAAARGARGIPNGVLVAKVGGSQLKVAKARRLRHRREGFGTGLLATRLTLTKKVATRLNKKLRTRNAFREGQVLGTARARARPLTATILDRGRATFIPDPAFLAKLDSHFVSLNPIAPAERAPGPIFTLPIIPGGDLAPDAGLGTLRTGGSLELLQLGSGQVFWHEPWFDLGAHDVFAEADIQPAPPYPGKLGQLPILDLGAGSVSSDPKARTITVSGAPLTLTAASAESFNQAFASNQAAFMSAEPVGVISFTAQAQ